MIGRVVAGGVAVLVAQVAAVSPVAAQSGLDIMKKQRDLQRAKDEEEGQRMTLVSKTGDTKQRRIVRYTLTIPDDLSKILM
ncbi:MAG: hypothetical protein HY728_01510, partial [Candidatus Rokubacteria bacterium]|nr:hypothetical protein [Candidatus Rokubacteria bacterium]